MARGVNKVILIGNLGQAPEVRSAGAQQVATLSVATSEAWTDKQTGEKKEKTEWHRVVAWGRLAEICGQYLGKGSKVYIEGKLSTRKWQDKDGHDRYTTEIVASEMQMLDGAKQRDSGYGGGYGDPGPSEPDRTVQRVVERVPSAQRYVEPQANVYEAPGTLIEDDIPF